MTIVQSTTCQTHWNDSNQNATNNQHTSSHELKIQKLRDKLLLFWWRPIDCAIRICKADTTKQRFFLLNFRFATRSRKRVWRQRPLNLWALSRTTLGSPRVSGTWPSPMSGQRKRLLAWTGKSTSRRGPFSFHHTGPQRAPGPWLQMRGTKRNQRWNFPQVFLCTY